MPDTPTIISTADVSDADYRKLVSDLKKPGAAILQSLTPEKCDALHMVSCLAPEIGELVLAIDENDRENIVEELGDIEFYLEGLRQVFNILREDTLVCREVIARNILVRLPSEAGDVFDACKKYLIYEGELNRQRIVTALCVLENALLHVRLANSISYQETRNHNYDKLRNKRYKSGTYSNEAALKREDKNTQA